MSSQCVTCRVRTAREGFTTCGPKCQAYADCTDPSCPCNATQCVCCGGYIQAGEFVCSRVCLEEVDLTTDMDTFTATLYPHG